MRSATHNMLKYTLKFCEIAEAMAWHRILATIAHRMCAHGARISCHERKQVQNVRRNNVVSQFTVRTFVDGCRSITSFVRSFLPRFSFDVVRDWAIVDRFRGALAHKNHVCIMARLSDMYATTMIRLILTCRCNMARIRQSSDSATVCKQMRVRVCFIFTTRPLSICS